jgi:hypothetical protein
MTDRGPCAHMRHPRFWFHDRMATEQFRTNLVAWVICANSIATWPHASLCGLQSVVGAPSSMPNTNPFMVAGSVPTWCQHHFVGTKEFAANQYLC